MVDQPSEMPLDQIEAVRRAARERRRAWARRPLISAAADPSPATRSTIATPAEMPSVTLRNGRAWSVNVEVVDQERLVRGWTQRELAHRAGVDQGTLSDLLARRRRPTLGTVQAICTALRLTLAQVIAFDGPDAT